MVKFWPWAAGDDAASFERTLKTLSTKISRAGANNDVLRQRSRRVRVMWTLYAGFAYILAAVLLLLVTGWKSWGAVEISIVSGGPVLIYLVRMCLTTYYDYRISNTQAYLNRLNSERDSAIERLKAATKYNTTHELLEKYGNSPLNTQQQLSPSSAKKSQGGPVNITLPAPPSGPRTGFAPPPTANIPRYPTQQSSPSTPQRLPSWIETSPPGSSSGMPPVPDSPPSADFAPNAFGPQELTPRQFSSSTAATFTQPRWYDRILDALLGEDETQPKNRLALVCSQCRLVNGQAPPGTRTVEDIGRWRCGECRAWNGTEKKKLDADVEELMQSWESEKTIRKDVSQLGGGVDSDNRETEDDAGVMAGDEASSGVGAGEDERVQPARVTRSKARGRGGRK